jgi:hypothetical protein
MCVAANHVMVSECAPVIGTENANANASGWVHESRKAVAGRDTGLPAGDTTLPLDRYRLAGAMWYRIQAKDLHHQRSSGEKGTSEAVACAVEDLLSCAG